jgi:NAD-reducing hydrogenase large subunit
VLYCIEQVEMLLNHPNILDRNVRAIAGVNHLEGIGMTEAPRGTLVHHYKVNQDGLVEWANMIIASGNNNLAMNKGVLQVARNYVRGDKLQEGMLNRVEAVVRAFDPCLACSTHAAGQMPLNIELYSADGDKLDELTRG